MNTPVSHAECAQHRKDMEDLIERRVKEAEGRLQSDISEIKKDIKTIYGKVDAIKWYILALAVTIALAALKLGVV